jgi:hypothetical protein
MMSSNRSIGALMLALAFCLTTPAGAVENLDSGKTGAQLYASDCVICHKNPGTLAKAGGVFGLSNFLREHYTASSQSADTIAGYLESVARTQPQVKRPAAAKRKAKGDEKAKAGEEKKPDSAKSGEAQLGKPAEAKTSVPEALEPKISEPKTSEPKTSEPKTSDRTTSEPKTLAPRPPEAIPGQPKAEAKPEKPANSD